MPIKNAGNQEKAVVIGLDGASWHLLEQMITAGSMPNLKRIVKNGTSGILKSTLPPYTAPAWVSCVTGVNPGKHNIYGFFQRSENTTNREFIGSNYVKVPKLWHHLNKAGKSVGLINIPITYPAEKVDGFVVPCFLTPLDAKDYTYPVSIYRDVLVPGDYTVNVPIAKLNSFNETTLKEVVQELLTCTKNRFQTMLKLKQEYQPDFMMIVFTSLDKIQHKFWKYLDASDPMYHDPFAATVRCHTMTIYAYIDEIIGCLMDSLDEHTTLYLVSDHGFCAKNKMIFLNKWLADKGFLKLNKIKLIQRLIQKKWFAKPVDQERNIDVLQQNINALVHFKKSLFISGDPYEQGIYSLHHNRKEEFTISINRLISELKELKDPECDKLLIDKVYLKEQLYSGKFVYNAPDLILKLSDYRYTLSNGYSLKSSFIAKVKKPFGTHHPDGIIAVYGKNVLPNQKTDATIWDVAPTILYNMGLPIHTEMDGKIMDQVFTPSFLSVNHPLTPSSDHFVVDSDDRVDYDEEQKQLVAERLHDLGYFD